MPSYFVTWEPEIDADTPREAAQRALEIHRDPDSTATRFKVIEEDTEEIIEIDLLEEAEA